MHMRNLPIVYYHNPYINITKRNHLIDFQAILTNILLYDVDIQAKNENIYKIFQSISIPWRK